MSCLWSASFRLHYRGRGTAARRCSLLDGPARVRQLISPGHSVHRRQLTSHLVDGRTSTDRDVLACHWLDLAGIASPPSLGMWTIHQPAVAGDIDIEAGHWSLPDEAVEVFTQEHEIGQAPVQRPSGHAVVVDASPWLESRAAEQRLLATVRWSIREQGWRAVEPAGRMLCSTSALLLPSTYAHHRRPRPKYQRAVDNPTTRPLPQRAHPRPRPSARRPPSLSPARRRPYDLDVPYMRSDGVRAAAQQTLHVHFKGLRQGSASVRISNK